MIEALRRNMMAKSGLIEDDSKKYILANPEAYFFIDIPSQYKTIGVKMVVEAVEGNGFRQLFGAYSSMCVLLWYLGYDRFSLVVNNPYYTKTRKEILLGKHVFCNNFMDSQEFSVDDEVITEGVGSFTLNRQVPFYILTYRGFFDGIKYNSGVYKVYSFAISSGSDIIFDFIPYIENGIAGFYDKVNEVFYPSITNVPFEYGEDV